MAERRLLLVALAATLGGSGARPAYRDLASLMQPAFDPLQTRPVASDAASVAAREFMITHPPSPPADPPLPFAAAIAAGADDNNGNLIFKEGTLLPEVQCLEYMAVRGSKELPLFTAQMQALGLWDRVTLHLVDPDPDGKAAGCFRSHVAVWNSALARGCEHALMLEEDLYFNEPAVPQAMASANAFLAAKQPYDMLFLGYTPMTNNSGGLLTAQVRAAREIRGAGGDAEGGEGGTGGGGGRKGTSREMGVGGRANGREGALWRECSGVVGERQSKQKEELERGAIARCTAPRMRRHLTALGACRSTRSSTCRAPCRCTTATSTSASTEYTTGCARSRTSSPGMRCKSGAT